MKLMSQKMNNLRLPILFSSIFFLVFISSSFLFATPSFAARVGHSLVQEEVTKIPQYKLHEEPEIPEEPELPLPEEPELPLPEEPEIPEEPEVPEDPEEPEVPEEPEEPEEPPKEPEEPKFGFPSWIPSFPFPGVNGGSLNSEKTKPTETVDKVPAKSTSVSEETSSGSNKKP
uniref:IgA FC receptor n=1 Tax=Noccaea caerulescens TaxID=107243 RepID=A0A1J3JH30_NOCCA